MTGFLIEVADGRYGERDERHECATVEEAEARWQELSGQLHDDATQNIGLLASGLLDELCEIHPETGVEITATRIAPVVA